MSFSKLMTLGQLKKIGVKDERWTIQDKLFMYKGVIKIHNREQRNQIKDTNVLRKKNYKKIALLRKQVKELHEQVATCLYGDASITRRLLHTHRDLQLTYMNMSLDKVIEDLNHRLFCRKKSLNVIRHKKSQKKHQLLVLQVQQGDLKSFISDPDFQRMDLKQQAITNAIQNYDVKFCAAKNIQSVYKRMLAILHKDQRFYEAILVTLYNDSNIQHKCLIRATEMGQLAMEEMANMKAEYSRLEKEVRANMTVRETNLKEIRDRLVDLREETLGLVRTESEFDLPRSQSEEPRRKGKDLETELRDLDGVLARLKEVTMVPHIKSILPSMLQTLKQKKRLLEELRLNAAAYDDMLNKKNHADLMFYSLYHSGAEATLEYEAEYNKIKNQIEGQKTKLDTIIEEQDKISNMAVKLRRGLQRLCQILEEVKLPRDYEDEIVTSWPVHNIAELLRPLSKDEELQRPPINQEALRLIHLMDSKLKFVKMRLRELGKPEERERAFFAHFKHVSEFMSNHLYPPEGTGESPALIVDVALEDPQVPNRLEIKARSQEIYIEATRNPFDVVEPRKGKKKGK